MTMAPEDLANLLERQWTVLVAWVGRQNHWAEDVVQQAFLRLAVTDPPPENPAAWLFRVSRNLAHNQRRDASRRTNREQRGAKSESVAGRADAMAEANELWRLLDRLEPSAREVVIAKIWGGLSFEDIAGAVGQSRSTVWRQYEQSLAMLRQFYGEQTVPKHASDRSQGERTS